MEPGPEIQLHSGRPKWGNLAHDGRSHPEMGPDPTRKGFWTVSMDQSGRQFRLRRQGRQPDCRHARGRRFLVHSDGKYQQISAGQGLSSAYVLCLCLDQEGNLWVGTDGGGLDRIKRKIFNTPDGLHPWNVQSLSEDAHGGLWVAFGALGAAYWDTNSVQYFHVGPFQDAWTVLVDHQQHIVAGTRDQGLFQFDTNSFQPVPGAESLGLQISVLFEDQEGKLWVGTP